MTRQLLPLVLVAACGGDNTVEIDAAPTTDAALTDAAITDAALTDASIDAAPSGFGAITGMCGVITDGVLTTNQPVWFQGNLDFGTDRYDDPADRPRLTPGGLEIILDGNAGGSSVYSELFAYEWLARCENAALLKTENEITYDVVGKKADLLVSILGRKVGVSVTRAVHFPFGEPYTMTEATTLLQRKLDDLALATTQVSAADLWTEQMVAAEAYDAQHAQVFMDAWNALTPETKRETILVVAVTDGDDLFIYTDQ
jgi:hypothetical protein